MRNPTVRNTQVYRARHGHDGLPRWGRGDRERDSQASRDRKITTSLVTRSKGVKSQGAMRSHGRALRGVERRRSRNDAGEKRDQLQRAMQSEKRPDNGGKRRVDMISPFSRFVSFFLFFFSFPPPGSVIYSGKCRLRFVFDSGTKTVRGSMSSAYVTAGGVGWTASRPRPVSGLNVVLASTKTAAPH